MIQTVDQGSGGHECGGIWPGSGASWSLPTGAWSSGLTSVPVPRLGRGKWEEPEIALEGSVLGSGLHWAEGKGFWTTSPTHLSSVQGHARHKTKYLPRPPGSSAGAFMSAPLFHSVLPSVGFNLPCPSFPLSPAPSFFRGPCSCFTQESSPPATLAVPAWVAVLEICRESKFRSPRL